MTTPVGFADCSVFIKHTSDPEPYAITFGVATDLANFDVDDHAAHVFGATASSWDQALRDTCTFTGATLRFGQDGGDDLVAEFFTSPLPGLATTEGLPQNCAVLVRKVTAFGGRRNRGRCFVPMVVDEGSVSETGVISTSVVGALQTAADGWMAALIDDNGGIEPVTPMVILHSPLVSGEVPTPTPVTGLQVDTVIATQRRRLRR